MRHQKKGRRLGRSASHRRALFRNLASSLFLTERHAHDEAYRMYLDHYDLKEPKYKGRIVTTLQKAKEIRPLVEKCITIARKGILAEKEAKQYATKAERGTQQWKQWRESEQWRQWNQAMAPAIHARRRVLQMLGDKDAVRVLFEAIAPRFLHRDGGYTRIVRLAKPRLGDAGTQAMIELCGTNDRVKQVRSVKPKFDEGVVEEKPAAAAEEPQTEESSQEETAE